MGAGIAKQIAKEWPQAFDVDKQTSFGLESKLGAISVAYSLDGNMAIVNAYTQFQYGNASHKFEYGALRSCLSKAFRHADDVSQYAPEEKFRIGIPHIGAGLAGGIWNHILDIIVDEVEECEYDLDEFVVVEYQK